MHIVEIELQEPQPFHRGLRLNNQLLREAAARIFESGESDDITSKLWNNPTHSWLLHVRQDGTGVLSIRPTARIATIEVAKGREATQSLREVTHVLAHRGIAHYLAGTQIMESPRARMSMLFKVVCTLGDEDPLMQWINDSRPRSIPR